jgi:hypothetical protein
MNPDETVFWARNPLQTVTITDARLDIAEAQVEVESKLEGLDLIARSQDV